MRTNQSGFAAHLIVLALVLVSVIGFAGYRVATMHKSATAVPAATSVKQPATVPATISSTADLNVTSQSLTDSGTALNTSLDDTQLDTDMNAML